MLKNLLNSFERRESKIVKLHITEDKFNYSIYFSPHALDTIKLAKGIDNDAQLARMLGITRSYLSMLKNKKAQVTAEVIVRVAVILNNTTTNWHKFFVIVPSDEKISYQKENMAKYKGHIPYDKHSLAAEHRKLDNPEVEKKI